jgi:chemotaxis response regulator CheB
MKKNILSILSVFVFVFLLLQSCSAFAEVKNSQIKVLICDDSAFMRDMLKTILKVNNYTIAEYYAVHGDMAINFYKQFHPDIVIMDTTIPDRDETLKTLETLMSMDPPANVIMTSAEQSQNWWPEWVRAGAIAFIQKPYNDQHVVSQLDYVKSKLYPNK